MVSILWSIISLGFGLLFYLGLSAIGPAVNITARKRIGEFYFGLAARSFQQVALVRRTLAGYDLLPIGVNDEQKHAQVTLSSGIIGDDKKLPFKDPDNRIKRWQNKPFAVVPEMVPAAVDAELAEIGHYLQRHDEEGGIEKGDKIDPYIEASDELRLVDPVDAVYLITKNAQPEYVETAEQFTKERLSKYGSKIGLAETVGVITGYLVGVGGVVGIRYVQTRLLGGGGGGDGVPTDPLPMQIMPPDALFEVLPMLV